MKRFTMIVGLLFILTGQMAFGQTLTFQGVLRDPVGRTVEDGEYTLTVRLYEAEVEGEVLWSEVHPDVPIHHGVFSIELGSVQELEKVSFDRQYWLGISVEDADEMYPRFKLSTAPSSLSIRGKGNLFPYIGNVGIGTLEPATELYITGDGDNYITVNTDGMEPSGFAFDGSGTKEWELNLNPADNTLNVNESGVGSAVTIAPGGNVGIGTAQPSEKLHIAGESGATGLTVDGNIRTGSGLRISDDRFIGSDGGDYVGLKSGANWGLTVTTAGSIGIGTTTPEEVLEVNGDVKLSAGGSIIFSDGTAISTATVGGSSNYLSNTADAVITADDNGDSTGSIQFLTRNETKMTLTNDGLLGLGTENPEKTLEINGDVNFTGELLKNGSPFVSTPWGSSGANIYTYGNVGIGTLNPNFKLDVNGAINASGGILKNGASLERKWELVHTSYDPLNAIREIYTTNKVIITSTESGINDVQNISGNLVVSGDRVVIGDQYNIRLHIDWDPQSGTSFYPLASVMYMSLIGNGGSYPVDKLYGYNINYDSYYNLSDRRTKENIRPLTNSLEKVLKLDGIRYDINTDTHPMFVDREIEAHERTEDLLGFVAQDLKEIIPEIVVDDENYELYVLRNQQQLLPVLVEALKELKAKNDALRERAAAVRAELAELGNQ